jgi:ribosomal-protein-serine acetyltransferase
LGFDEEGVVRRAEWLYDHFVDHVVYAMPSGAGPNQPSPSG